MLTPAKGLRSHPLGSVRINPSRADSTAVGPGLGRPAMGGREPAAGRSPIRHDNSRSRTWCSFLIRSDSVQRAFCFLSSRRPLGVCPFRAAKQNRRQVLLAAVSNLKIDSVLSFAPSTHAETRCSCCLCCGGHLAKVHHHHNVTQMEQECQIESTWFSAPGLQRGTGVATLTPPSGSPRCAHVDGAHNQSVDQQPHGKSAILKDEDQHKRPGYKDGQSRRYPAGKVIRLQCMGEVRDDQRDSGKNKSDNQEPQGQVHRSSTALAVLWVRKCDSEERICKVIM